MEKYIKIYGERNTNTNYVSQLIRLNLEARELPGVVPEAVQELQKKFPGREKVRDIYFYLTYKHNLGWKHTCVKPVNELKKYRLVNERLCFLTITKNPYSWLLSLYRNPYHLYFGAKKPDFETFLQMQTPTLGRDNIKRFMLNPIELWNMKNASYLPLTELNALNITTEKLIEDPETVINSIGSRFSISRRSGEFINFERSTKDSSKDFAYYRDYYLNERWRRDLSEEAISIINASLDRDLMQTFGYQVLPEYSYNKHEVNDNSVDHLETDICRLGS